MNNLKEAGQRIRATQSHGLGPSGDSSFFGSMASPSFAHSVAHLIITYSGAGLGGWRTNF